MDGNVITLYSSLARVNMYKHFRAPYQGLVECVYIAAVHHNQGCEYMPLAGVRI